MGIEFRKSMNLRAITQIRNKIIQMINDNQEIKRLIKYLTSTPLENQGYDKLGNLVQQPDIEDMLINKNIYPVSFSDKISNDVRVILFIHRHKGDLRSRAVANNTLIIDVVTPSDYMILEGQNADRNTEIAYRIMNLIDDKIIDSIGKIQIVRYHESRISSSNDYNILSLFVKINTSNLRGY